MGFSPTLYGFSLHALAAGRAGAVRWMSMGLLAASTLLVVIFQFVDPENLMKVLKGRIDAFLLTRWVDLGAAVLPVLVRTYGPYLLAGLVGLLAGLVMRRRSRH